MKKTALLLLTTAAVALAVGILNGLYIATLGEAIERLGR